MVHRLDDGAYLAVQIKAKSAVGHREAPIAIYEDHLFTSDQIVIGVLLERDLLGPYALVVDAASLKRKAARIIDRGRAMLIVDMPVSPKADHKWSEHLVELGCLAERLGVPPAPALPSAIPGPVPSDEDRVIGFMGEQEVCGRLASLDQCALFRPFPDNEFVEIVLRRLATGSTVGLQVKTAQLDQPHDMRHVLIHRATFVGAASTFIIVLAWIVSGGRFHDNFLLIPSSDIPSIASSDGPYYELHFRPDGSAETSHLDRYRMPLTRLSDAVSGLLT